MAIKTVIANGYIVKLESLIKNTITYMRSYKKKIYIVTVYITSKEKDI